MTIAWKDEVTIKGKVISGTSYVSDKFVTKEMQEQANALDVKIKEELILIRDTAKKQGLLGLKGKSGVIKLWHFLGIRLNIFIDKNVLPEDIEYIWRAIWDNIPEELCPGDRKSTLVDSKRDPIRYCFLLGKYDKDFVEKAGNWRAWREFLDRKQTHHDKRIVIWLGEKRENPHGRNWLRKFNTALGRAFASIDTTIYSDEELAAELTKIWEEALFQK